MSVRRIVTASLGIVAGLLAAQAAQAQKLSLESKYLSSAASGYHGYRIDGKLGGAAKLTLDPNSCGLDQWGDRTICTKIALTIKNVTLHEAKIKDPTGQGRRLFSVSGHGLTVDLKLVTTKSADDGWFVLTSRSGQRRIVDLDPATTKFSTDAASRVCDALAETVAGTTAKSKVVAGIGNNSWVLLLRGKKPNLNTTVEFKPVVYVKRPDYWEIHVVECSNGIVLPTISKYDVSFDITSTLGHKGIELVFSDKRVRLNVPPPAPAPVTAAK